MFCSYLHSPGNLFSRNLRVSRDTLRGCGKSEYEPMI